MRYPLRGAIGSSLVGAAFVALALTMLIERERLLLTYLYWLTMLVVACCARYAAFSAAEMGAGRAEEGALWPVSVLEGVVLPATWVGATLLLPTGEPAADLLIHLAFVIACWGACPQSQPPVVSSEIAFLHTLNLHRVPLVALAVVDLWSGQALGYALAFASLLVLVAMTRSAGVSSRKLQPTPRQRPGLPGGNIGVQRSDPVSRYLAMTAHDLRQPLQGMRLALQAYRESNGMQRPEELLEVVEEAVRSLTPMVDAMLEFVRTQRRLDSPHIERAEVSELVAELSSIHRPEAHSRGLSLIVDVAPAIVYTDEALFKRAVGNLISNAIRNTTKGAVVLRSKCEDGRLHLDVMDTGSGIHPQDRDRIFEDFYRAEASDPQEPAGLGLGLPIVRRICEELGIEILIESEVGLGTCIRLVVPLSDEQRRLPAPADETAPKVFLAVADTAVRSSIRHLLASWGMATTEATGDALRPQLLQSLGNASKPILVVDESSWKALQSSARELLVSEEWAVCGAAVVVLAHDPASLAPSGAGASGPTVLQLPVQPIQLRACLSFHLATGQPVADALRE